jgi:hypothetical protein
MELARDRWHKGLEEILATNKTFLDNFQLTPTNPKPSVPKTRVKYLHDIN